MGSAIYVPNVDWSSGSLGRVTLTETVAITGLAISGPSTIIGSGQFSIIPTPVFATQRSVTWSVVSGSQYASINSSGVLSATSGALANDVTIRATSTADSSIYAEKTVSVTFGTIVYYDYLESDGNGGYFLIDGVLNYGGKLKVITTLNNNNGWAFGSCHNLLSSGQTSPTMLGIYRRTNEGTVGYSASGYQNSGVTVNTSVRYRVEYTLSANASTNGTFKLFNDSSGSQLYTVSNKICYLNADISVFTYGWNSDGPGSSYTPGDANYAATKFFGLVLEDANANTLINIRCATVGGTPMLIDTVSGKAYSKIGNGTITAGNLE